MPHLQILNLKLYHTVDMHVSNRLQPHMLTPDMQILCASYAHRRQQNTASQHLLSYAAFAASKCL